MTDILETPAIGHNKPPEPCPFEAHRINIEDLYGEAKNWLDGTPIADAKQAEAVEQLMDMLRKGKAAADDSRKVENEPFDTGKAEVQARYNPILKKADTALDACKAVRTTWLNALAAEKAKAAAKAQAEAAEKAQRAADAIRAANPTSLEDRERVDQAVAAAERAGRVAGFASKDTVKGLRTYWVPTLTNGVEAARHYWLTQREACEAFFLSLAKTDVLQGKRQIPGFDVAEEKRAV